jgi:Na+/melibiose symporter-like transporter
MKEEKVVVFSKKKTFTLGFGFLGVSVIWALYNAYVPIFLKQFGLTSFVVGLIMTIDNIFAVLLLPYLGALSDRTKTRLGRRRPFILGGAPFAMIFFFLIPYATLTHKLPLMMLTIVLMNLSMALFRTPVIALMPDITPSAFRSQANGIINFMGGLGALLVFFGGKSLYDANIAYPFIAGGILMLLASLVVVFTIKEDKSYVPDDETSETKTTIKESVGAFYENLKDIFAEEKSLMFILLAIFSWFVGFNAIETFFTSYAKFYLGIKESTGALILGIFALSFMVASLVTGYIGAKKGRNKTIRTGLLVITVVMTISMFLHNFYIIAALFLIGGFGWALINVNSLPMVVDMTTLKKVGGYTGLYYFFSQAANIIAPPLSGLAIDIFGYPSLMFFASFFFIVAFIMMHFVKRGEITTEELPAA